VPSKIFESLASARPILLSASGEAASIIDSCGGGRTTHPGAAEQLCQAVIDFLDRPDEADEAGQRGRACVAERFDRRKTAARFVEVMGRLVDVS
jgi:glycosyltransferase involved in cell wall biosynthesis